HGMVFRFDGQLIELVAQDNLEPEQLAAVRSVFPIRPGRESITGRAVLTRALVHVRDRSKDPELQYGILSTNFPTTLSVPLLRDGAPLGAITVTRAEVALFSDRQVELVRTFADQAVIAIENVRLFEAEQQRSRELSESLEQQTATSEVLKVVSSSPGDMTPVFEAMLANALRICEAKFGHLLLYDGERFHATHLHDVPSSYREFWQQHGPIKPGPNTGLARLANTKQVVHIPDLQADSAYAEREPLRVIAVEQVGARSLVAVPM